MRILISSIGSRGDVQPAVALAIELRSGGHEVLLCVAPNFRQWVESFGIDCIVCGQDTQHVLQYLAKRKGYWQPLQTMRGLLEFLRIELQCQFDVLYEAALNCDVIVGGGLQAAAGSIAELLHIPYIYAAFCPTAIPSQDHPPPWSRLFDCPSWLEAFWLNQCQWQVNEVALNSLFRRAFNAQRAAYDLPPVKSIWRTLLGNHPWLAADSTLAPLGRMRNVHVEQFGTWFLDDPTPLPENVERFLKAGEPPIYFGFGSIAAANPMQVSRAMVSAARSVGKRAVISRGWSQFGAIDASDDCIAIDPVPHEKLFPRVAAVVHHGGAGTTAAAARAGKPQVVVPHVLDQFYWAHRIQKLQLGFAFSDRTVVTAQSLSFALRECMQLQTCLRADAMAAKIDIHGARAAAKYLIEQFDVRRRFSSSSFTARGRSTRSQTVVD